MIYYAVLNGMALGSIYALLALGFVLIFKATKVINFAQGDMMMVCAYVNLGLLTNLHFSFLAAILLTIFLGAVLGWVLERLIIRPMVGEPLFAVIIVTVGMASVLRAIVGMIWGHDIMSLPTPIPSNPVKLFGIPMSVGSLLIVGTTLLLVVILALYFKFTKGGTAMRAASLDGKTALLMGIRVREIFSKTWIVSGFIAAICAILIGPIVHLSTHLGLLGLNAFPAAILGGFGSIPGAILGGFVLGVSENIAGGYLPEGFKAVFPWIVLIAVLMIRPEGFFGTYEEKKL
ncbi:branched-chain amino acid ABC transporter permease [Thermodesulfobacteriota bacterium]